MGSKSTQPSAGGYLMRSLAVWRRSLSAQEVKNVYLAGKKTFAENTRFSFLKTMVLCIAVVRSYGMICTVPWKR